MGWIDEQTRNAIALAFTNIVKQGPLNGLVNTQRMALAIHTLLEHTEAGQGVELEALYHHLTVDNKAPVAAAIEALCVLKSKESTFRGVRLELPQACLALSDGQRAGIVDAFNARWAEKKATSSGIHKVGGPIGGTPMAGTAAVGEKQFPGIPPAAPPPAPPAAAGPMTIKKGKATTSGPSVGLFVALGLALAGLGGSFAYRSATRPPPLVPIVFPSDPAGLPCQNPAPPMSQGFARCVIPKALWDKEGMAGVMSRAAVTMTSVRSSGVVHLLIVTQEDSKVRAQL